MRLRAMSSTVERRAYWYVVVWRENSSAGLFLERANYCTSASKDAKQGRSKLPQKTKWLTGFTKFTRLHFKLLPLIFGWSLKSCKISC